ncbi:hypothetical protein IAG41_06555 [Sphingomonas sp. JC676]|uniref:hypothetical protein n=1 Tax=Sphingomonas sp. JC676 TaxID=2768065 RepID=UPI0016579917|nr:hypothetical protein [Sphingomonas sp. JC676]MBC9032047.1 hypothetical protein [Sphingomonas sp. JC676]
MLKYLAPALLAMVAPNYCFAQTSEASGAGKITSIGTPHDTIASMLLEMNVAQRTRDNCWNLGCLVIVNETKGYDVIAFYVDMAKPGGKTKWGPNQFQLALSPRSMTLKFKTGGPSTCDQPIRFVLRHQKTKEKIELDGTASLCTTPHQDAVIHVKVLEPNVIIEDGAASSS